MGYFKIIVASPNLLTFIPDRHSIALKALLFNHGHVYIIFSDFFSPLDTQYIFFVLFLNLTINIIFYCNNSKYKGVKFVKCILFIYLFISVFLVTNYKRFITYFL